MAALISLKPGRVAYVNLGADAQGPAMLTMDPKLDSVTVVITKFQMDQSVNVQFQRTLQKAVYAYTFGDQMADAMISGMAFVNASCESGGKTESGIDKVVDYYTKNRMSVSLAPIKITFASRVIEGYLVGASFNSADTETYSCGFSFALKLASLENRAGV